MKDLQYKVIDKVEENTPVYDLLKKSGEYYNINLFNFLISQPVKLIAIYTTLSDKDGLIGIFFIRIDDRIDNVKELVILFPFHDVKGLKDFSALVDPYSVITAKQNECKFLRVNTHLRAMGKILEKLNYEIAEYSYIKEV